MAFMDLFRPKWKHSDSGVRLAAVRMLTDQVMLAGVAENDRDLEVRLAAVGMLTDQGLLAEIAEAAHVDDSVREAAIEMLTDQTRLFIVAGNFYHPMRDAARVRLIELRMAPVTDQAGLAEIAKQDSPTWFRLVAVRMLTDEGLLAEVAKTDTIESDVRSAAVGKLTDQTLLAEIAMGRHGDEVRIAAIKTLTDQAVLAEMAKTVGFNLRTVAVAKLTDQALLAVFAKTNSAFDVRMSAIVTLTDQTVLAEIAKNDSEEDVYAFPDLIAVGLVDLRAAAIRKLSDRTVLAEIAETDRWRERVTEWETDRDVAYGSTSWMVYPLREAAARRLAELAKNEHEAG